MANMHLVTGYAGEEHIESNDDRSFHAAYYGNGEYVMDRGQQFAASIISNNKVRVLDGDIMMQGGHIRKKENTYNEVAIENGAQGYMRNDLIGVTYEKDQTTGIETSNMVVIKGAFYEGTQGDPSHDPEYIHGDIVDGGAVYNFMPLYRAELENLTLKRLTPLFRTIGTFADSIREFQNAFDIMMEASEAAVVEMIEQAKKDVEEAIEDGFGSILRVSTDEESLRMKKVIATNGSETKEAMFNMVGVATIRIPWTGETTITATDGTEEASSKVSMPYFGEYEAELSFYKLYGFVEHMAVSAPAQRIEYLEENRNYTPAGMNFGSKVFSYGSWEDWDWLRENLPYMVGWDGVKQYQLNPSDYTKKADGSASDVSNQSFAGGAYSWIPKIYRKSYISGTDRYVYFCRKKLDDDFLPTGFVDFNDNELEGVWLPMFYGANISNKMRSIAGTTPVNTQTTATEWSLLQAAGARHVFLGGAIVNVLNDILLMIGKSTDIQSKFGAGFNKGGSAASSLKANTIVGGGQFYGTSDNTSLNKLFHSVVYGSFQQWQRDPYTILNGGQLYVSPHYKYNLSATGYTAAGKSYGTSSGWTYTDKMKEVPGFGPVPDTMGATTATGYCDGFYSNASGVRVALRFGTCGLELIDGPFALDLNNEATTAAWDFGASDLLLPPVGVAI